MKLTEKLLVELQRRLKIGNRRGVHLNAIPARSRYKFDLNRLSHIDKNLPNNFIKALLSEQPLKFRISWKDNVPDLNSLFEEEQIQLVRITKAFENLINQTEAIESEKGINTFGFGFPILARRDKADNKLTIAPILIWSLRIKRTKEFNTWEILRNEDDPIYINEVLINHLQSDSNIEIEQISSEMLDDGLIQEDELIEICSNLIRTVNTSSPDDLEEIFKKKLKKIISVGDKAHYEKLPLSSNNSFIEFGGLFSIFEVQKQNIINEYSNLLELTGIDIPLDDLEGHSFQPISSVETDPSQQGILHSLESTRNILIQGPPGTGKSQTLTAVLINALENNKKTIVVCEKIGALEVLEKALIKRGLNHHYVLVRDIVKDRKKVVESVRDRVDSTNYRRYQYASSKENLEETIQKAKYLISNINKKHQKLGKKILGSKSWTDVVGELLKETKNIDGKNKLNIDKSTFIYSIQEINAFLDIIQKAESLYQKFSPIESKTFINSDKLVGDNPFIIEQALKESFNAYESDFNSLIELFNDIRHKYIQNKKEKFEHQAASIRGIISDILNQEQLYNEVTKDFQELYFCVRYEELDSQNLAIENLLEKNREAEPKCDNILKATKDAYSHERNTNFNNYTNNILQLISKIDDILDKYTGNRPFFNKKLNSFVYKIKAKFSKNTREMLEDYELLVNSFLSICETISSHDYLDRIEYTDDVKEIKSHIEYIKNNLISQQSSISNKITEELQLLNFHGLKNEINIDQYFESTYSKINTLLPKAIRKTITEIVKRLEEFTQCTNNDFDLFLTTLQESKDFHNTWKTQDTLNGNFNLVDEISAFIIKIQNSFYDIVGLEFAKFKFDTFYSEKYYYQDVSQRLETEIGNKNNSTKTKDNLRLISERFRTFDSNLRQLYAGFSESLATSPDFRINKTLNNSFNANKEKIKEFQDYLEKKESTFSDKIQKQFNNVNLLKLPPNEKDVEDAILFQEKHKALTQRIKSENWLKEDIEAINFNSFITKFKDLTTYKNTYLNSEEDLFSVEFRWFQFYNDLTENQKKIINELKRKENWSKTFLTFYLDSLLVNSASVDLPTNDDDHKNLHNALNGVEKEQLKFIKEFWFSKQIDTTRQFEQNNYGLSVENLYNKRSSRNFKRLSLRQIVQKDPDLFTTFFPIILTSPDVASNLFKGMNGYFDIVMFDEASQLRLEDNLPAILKGKQIVIAGDEHQMPPSNYFSKVFDGTIEDEDDLDEEDEIIVDKDNILLSCESLLDFGTELNFQKKYLDFHYRSRHPFLIDFSNYAFYNQRLKPLPNNFDYIPIKYVQVNGTFSEHTNEAEAEMVLSIIENNIHKLPPDDNGIEKYPTIGIATFNIAQRNLIKSKILERQKFPKYSEFNAKIQELEENGMFVKNLENIQGDERDVIILSTTYGVGKDGKFAQRFGPINHSKGYKLLNVIITRAKYKVYCCSSIPEQAFMNYKEYLTIEGSNNRRAVFFAYLAYCKAVSESDNDSRLSVLTALAENTTNSAGINPRDFGELESPFEEEVYQSLADHFGTEKLIPQLQFAGFRIDIVYDPQIDGVPKIAIECDGAKYHSSREAYLYDRHRQKILESHGFLFHRIWSTNWWRNPNRETRNLINFIEQVEKNANAQPKDYSQTAYAFTDDIEILEEYIAHNSVIDFREERGNIQAIDQMTSISSEVLTDNVVRLNSTVQVKYMNNGKDMDVQLVETENNKQTSNGIHKVYHKSPIGVSIIGHTVGDIVKVGHLDNFVEIIKITNS